MIMTAFCWRNRNLSWNRTLRNRYKPIVQCARGPAGRGRPAAGAVLMRPDEMRQNLTGVKVKLTMTTLSTNIRLTRDREGRADSRRL